MGPHRRPRTPSLDESVAGPGSVSPVGEAFEAFLVEQEGDRPTFRGEGLHLGQKPR